VCGSVADVSELHAASVVRVGFRMSNVHLAQKIQGRGEEAGTVPDLTVERGIGQ
jgi:hypothetical protein